MWPRLTNRCLLLVLPICKSSCRHFLRRRRASCSCSRQGLRGGICRSSLASARARPAGGGWMSGSGRVCGGDCTRCCSRGCEVDRLTSRPTARQLSPLHRGRIVAVTAPTYSLLMLQGWARSYYVCRTLPVRNSKRARKESHNAIKNMLSLKTYAFLDNDWQQIAQNIRANSRTELARVDNGGKVYFINTLSSTLKIYSPPKRSPI